MPSISRYRGKYRVQWYGDGKRRSRTLNTVKEARLFSAKIDTGDIEMSAVILTFKEFAKKWIKDYSKIEKAETQVKGDIQIIDKYLEPAFGELGLDQLKKSHLLEFRAKVSQQNSRTGKPLSPKTVNNILGQARKMLNTAVDWDLLKENPWVGVRPLKGQTASMEFWTPEERDTFIARAAQVYEPFARLVAVATHTGLRVGELAGLKREDLDFANKLIHVRRQYSVKLGKYLEETKGKRAEHVPMNKVVIAALSHTVSLEADEPVFERAMFHNSRRSLQRMCKRVGIRDIRFHDLRHTFASCLAMAGVDLMVIQKLMRHKSYQMTLRYSHLHPDHIRGTTEVLVPSHSDRTQQLPGNDAPSETVEGWWAHSDLNGGPAGYEDAS